MKKQSPKDGLVTGDKSDGSKSVSNKKQKMKRFGRQGRSLEKSINSYYNPSVIKKKREFYDNAKHVKKYKKLVNQQQTDVPLAMKALEVQENVTEDLMSRNNKRKDREPRNLMEIYEKKYEEREKARMEKEAIFQARKEERDKSESRRKDIKGKMMKKTSKGQPVMKYRIQHLLETIQGSMNKS